jgi:hypothetical protein
VGISRFVLWRSSNWKKVKNALATDAKLACDPIVSLIYHLANDLIKITRIIIM